MEIRTLYKSILESLNMEVNDEGIINMVYAGEILPSFCGKKRLVFPTQELLRQGVSDEVVAFHPISENIIRGESDVIKKLRGLIVFRTTSVISCLITELIGIAADKDYHAKLAPTQTDILTIAPRADNKTIDAFNKIIDSASIDGANKIQSIYLKRGGIWKGNKYSRLAKCTFPITDDFDKDVCEIFGVKLRKNDKEAFIKMFEYILPKCESEEFYSYGSNSMVAPYFHSLMKAYCKVATQLNKIVYKYRKHLDNPEELHIDVSWESELDDLSVYKDLIPSLKGNEGSEKAGEEETGNVATNSVKSSLLDKAAKLVGQSEPANNVTPTTTNGYQNIPSNQPTQVATVQSTPKSSGGGLDWDTLPIAKQFNQQQAPGFFNSPAVAPPTTRGGYQAPAPSFGYAQPMPGYNQPQFAQPLQQHPNMYQQPNNILINSSI